MTTENKELIKFVKDFTYVFYEMRDLTMRHPTTFEILAGIMVANGEDPIKLVELMKEMQNHEVV